MEIWESKADVVPVWWDVILRVPWVAIHTDVVKGVRPAKPATRTENSVVSDWQELLQTQQYKNMQLSFI